MPKILFGSVYVNNTAKVIFWHMERINGVWHLTEAMLRASGRTVQLDETYTASLEESIDAMVEKHGDTTGTDVYVMLRVLTITPNKTYLEDSLNFDITKANGNWYLNSVNGGLTKDKFNRIDEIVERFTSCEVA